jgi:agmatinase
MRAVAAAHGPLAVVHVDAHYDTSTAEVWGDPWHHGTPLRHAITEGLIAPGALVQIGVRGPCGAADDGQLVAQHGATTISCDAVDERGMAAIVGEVRAALGDRPLYVTFDVDGVDPAFAPGTGTPVPGGLSAREALQLIRGLFGLRLVGMDVVEVAPPLDFSDLTSHLAAHLLYEGLALLAHR